MIKILPYFQISSYCDELCRNKTTIVDSIRQNANHKRHKLCRVRLPNGLQNYLVVIIKSG